MSEVIRHQYGQISAHLDDMQRGIGGAYEVREASDRAFSLLVSSGAFVGQAGDRLQVLRQQHSQKTEEHISQLQAIHAQAVQQQIDTAMLDNQMAHGF